MCMFAGSAIVTATPSWTALSCPAPIQTKRLSNWFIAHQFVDNPQSKHSHRTNRAISAAVLWCCHKNFPDEQTLKLSYSSSMSSTARSTTTFVLAVAARSSCKDDGARALPTSIEKRNAWRRRFPSRTQIRQDLRFGTGDVAANAEQIRNLFRGNDECETAIRAAKSSAWGCPTANKMALGGSSSLGYQGSLTYNRSYSFTMKAKWYLQRKCAKRRTDSAADQTDAQERKKPALAH